MEVISQRDPRWAKKKLGKSPYTIGDFGCLASSICFLAQYFNGGTFVAPTELASKSDLFKPTGDLDWNKLNPYLAKHGFKYVKRIREWNDKDVTDALKDPDKAVVIECDHKSHWVAGVKAVITKYGTSYRTMDPWFATINDPKKVWGSLDGYALFERTK